MKQKVKIGGGKDILSYDETLTGSFVDLVLSTYYVKLWWGNNMRKGRYGQSPLDAM